MHDHFTVFAKRTIYNTGKQPWDNSPIQLFREQRKATVHRRVRQWSPTSFVVPHIDDNARNYNTVSIRYGLLMWRHSAAGPRRFVREIFVGTFVYIILTRKRSWTVVYTRNDHYENRMFEIFTPIKCEK